MDYWQETDEGLNYPSREEASTSLHLLGDLSLMLESTKGIKVAQSPPPQYGSI